ncbi:hypothetical protein [Streptomyces sp. SID13031]|uniref:hypothetical protein n=1 Tax=Streptomyces sp. SID13031 TaxID=2706046 RepID=UPI001943898F|nr:hypothetical protein [Streptomyces sp. SID13031]
MDGIWILLVSLAVVFGFLGLLAWAAARSRRRGIGASMMGPFEQMWLPTAAESQIEIQLQQERKKPIGSPEDL